MAKKYKNLDNIPIQWNGDLNHPDAGNKNQSIPADEKIVWGGSANFSRNALIDSAEEISVFKSWDGQSGFEKHGNIQSSPYWLSPKNTELCKKKSLQFPRVSSSRL